MTSSPAVPRAVLFDFAGTLFMPAPPEVLLGRAAAAVEVDLPESRLNELGAEYERAGVPGAPYPERVPDDLQDLYATRDDSPANHRRAALALAARVEQPHPALPEAFYDELLRPRSWVPYEDARTVVEELETRGVRVGMISNIGFDIRPVLREHGFAGLAERAALSFEVGATKPSAELFEAGLEQLGTMAEETLMVGDNAAADGGATGLGMRCLLLPMTPPGTRHGLELVLRLVGGASTEPGS
jgi:putative hydrolase of the HAD superfamily